MFRRKENNTAPLEKYIQQAWNTREALFPFGTKSPAASASVGKPAAPTLQKGIRNRIIYYIGSFNPPHVGHLALIEHVFANTTTGINSSSASASASPSSSPDELNAVALIVILHGETWIQRKLRKSHSRANNKEPLHLAFDQRYELVRRGIPEDLIHKGVWVFPEGLGDWWMFQDRLKNACQGDGFAMEFVELLGPDYVSQQRPQCSGYHGVVTSNICRKADFVVEKVEGDELVKLECFRSWERARVDEEAGGDGAQATGESIVNNSSVWVCKHVGRKEYRIWFVQHRNPALDPDLSSTALRQIISESKADELEMRLNDIAMSAELLFGILKETMKKS